MTRPYTLRRRAERQAETRQRIVEAAIALHGSVGPALTSISMVAARAKVQRHTLYAHFPDERSLYLACSGLSLERDPLPDPGPWRSAASREARLRAGLGAIYGWYERNADLAGCVLRDAEHHALTREVVGLRIAPWMQACREVLAEALSEGQRAVLHLALGYFTWRALTREAGLAQEEAVAAMVRAILGQP
ncbi:TetR/AcrR family transcriptional regulator [Roseomonas eburnea]|uniref:TetR/AcrR family transcriptional regulator n=1 Tax=Neoroseomonas eburnea TaxID=1346889 RepID=A0A9X9X779_9PROT|nr:TetR/AcrR family transcriptional regulator [Neoroseomonas eburnea]MBR0679565.1 TetR/AcrR family transcriptional regulator [Neoroseomonas eburnea]